MKDEVLWDSYNNLLLSYDIDRIRKLLARYELFKMVSNVPGSIVECGVFKGSGWIYWLKLLKIFSFGESKSVYGFDTFTNFSKELLDYEKKSADKFVDEASFKGINHEELLKNAISWGLENGNLIAGEVTKTIPKFVKENPGLRFSLVNLDFDTFNGTKIALDNFHSMMSPGGIIILDEYGKKGWGESDAVDSFLKNKNYKIKAVRQSFQPTAYIQF